MIINTSNNNNNNNEIPRICLAHCCEPDWVRAAGGCTRPHLASGSDKSIAPETYANRGSDTSIAPEQIESATARVTGPRECTTSPGRHVHKIDVHADGRLYIWYMLTLHGQCHKKSLLSAIIRKWRETRQDMTRQDKTRQDKTRHDKTRQQNEGETNQPQTWIQRNFLRLCTYSWS
jgi:hypothetical protein